jgi:hypothetical protein
VAGAFASQVLVGAFLIAGLGGVGRLAGQRGKDRQETGEKQQAEHGFHQGSPFKIPPA